MGKINFEEIYKKYEEQQKEKFWQFVKDIGDNVNAKRPFVYWDEIVEIIAEAPFLNDQVKVLLTQELEQKCWIGNFESEGVDQ